MKPKPYWALPKIEKIGLTECISSSALQPLEKILRVKREVAQRACSQILRKDPKTEIIALLGSVAHGDIMGWFSDIDMLVITSKPRKDEMVELAHEVLFIEYHNWASLEDLIVNKIKRDEYEERSCYLYFYGNPSYLYSTAKSRTKYKRIIRLGVEALWRDHSKIEEYLDDFIWFYGSAKEALRYNQPFTAIGKLQRGTVLLLRHYLIKNKILLRKPLPDDRTIVQLRNSHVPRELLGFIEKLYKERADIDTLMQLGKEMYSQVTNRRKWVNKIPL